MTLSQAEVAGSGTFPHGIHPPEQKRFSADCPIEVIASPGEVLLPLQQHLGAPAKLVVKAREAVVPGQVVAEAAGPVSAPVHAPIAGKTQKPVSTTLPNGRHVKALPIKAEGEQLAGDALFEAVCGGHWPLEGVGALAPEAIGAAIGEAGVVGLGGAAFPTRVKLTASDKSPIDTIVVNGCECEPYLTCDYRMMLEAPRSVVAGALLAARAVGASGVVIGVEDNKPDAVAALRDAASGAALQVMPVKTKYPQGSEKQLIKAVLGRTVPLGGLPMAVGVGVVNAATAGAIAGAVLRKRPLTHRVVSVTGGGVATPKNLLVPIGIRFRELIAACGGFTPEAARMVAGGPMMGFAFADLSMPVTKGTSGVTVLTAREIRKGDETHCVRCGRCVGACPMNLVPTKLALACRAGDLELAQTYHITACFECGSCAFTCPAQIPIVQLVRTGKALLAAARKK